MTLRPRMVALPPRITWTKSIIPTRFAVIRVCRVCCKTVESVLSQDFRFSYLRTRRRIAVRLWATHFFGKVCTSSLEKLTNVSFECFEARTKVESVQVLGGVNVQSTFPEYSSGPCCPKAGDVGVWYDVALVFVKY